MSKFHAYLKGKNKHITPSILSADFNHLGKSVEDCISRGMQILHFDVMDGHFVPAISFGPPVLKSLNKTFDCFFDVHLMVTHPQNQVHQFISAGADHITFHVESDCDIPSLIQIIKDEDIGVGLVVKPNTDWKVLIPFLADLDLILIMTVEPGAGGQAMLEDCLSKVVELKEYMQENGLDVPVQIDGGVNVRTMEKAVACGADLFVAGSAVFGDSDGTVAGYDKLDQYLK